ncbi:RNA 2',3'-cyclic phosphodiesterase [Aeromonas salmonicida]|uniref:RNA 2',3'-cyclic phosphodiesterase n=1 Tax=Aeromonas salmonicida TaxID=645 RepID=UPI001F1906B6|nr:RNA 2',3'-cyclic phosphodiesterase [Aeromonas salmonicida]MCE9935159.1 RNA 2',3'-cyclic phosphodiesterase [Aeromonas salmonicida]MDR6997247.1 2'-5' RNA ligase [Aeromonas salmonicida]
MAKLFFALPLQQLAPELIDWRDQRPWPGQPVPEANLHLTLAFLGEADQVTTARLMAAAERQHCPPLAITLDETGWFSRAKAAWVGPKAWPNELNVLARALRRHGEKLGLGNGEQGYRPHVTLSRKAGEAPADLPAPDFVLQADHFCLYQSVTTQDGVRYEPLACWPLRAREKMAS